MKKIVLSIALLAIGINAKLEWQTNKLTPNDIKADLVLSSEVNYLNNNRELLNRLLKNPKLLSQYITETILNRVNLNQKLNNRYLSNKNYVIDSGEGYVIRIACHSHRLRNLSRANNEFYSIGQGTIRTEELDKRIKNGKTYQTSSIYAQYIQLKNTIEKHNLTNIIVPATKIVSFNGSDDISDENCIVLQEKLENIGTKLEDFVKENTLSKKLTYEFLTTLINGCIWDVCKVRTDGEKIIITDLEQPHKIRPSEEYYNNDQDTEFSVLVGLQEAKNILGDSIVQWIKEGPFAQELKEFKNQKFLETILN